MIRLVALALLVGLHGRVAGFRVVQDEYDHFGETPTQYFEPYHPGFTGIFGDPTNPRRWRVNEGNEFMNAQPNIYEGVHARQPCPGMIGPDSLGHYYCTTPEAGYCDRRSGACFCFNGYEGIQCESCRPTHFQNGTQCIPKVLCPQDCSGAGVCDYATGKCTCDKYAIGVDCSLDFCAKYDPYCVECNAHVCQRCLDNYYVHPVNSTCVSCTVFDPRCTVCNPTDCLSCTDPLLKSIRRSGQRRQDAPLSFDELRRETSDYNPHMTQSRYAFDEGEKFYLVTDRWGLSNAGFVMSLPNTTFDTYVFVNGSVPPPTTGNPSSRPLSNISTICHQAWVYSDPTWTCAPWPISHTVCGHPGLFSFSSLTYQVWEDNLSLRITVVRSGGGLGKATVKYNLQHNTTNSSDVTPTMPYTASQTLTFEHGIVRKTFLLAINDDNYPEGDETFQLILSEPTGGASLGNQYITQVTILDDETLKPTRINFLNSTAAVNISSLYPAGQEAQFSLITRNYQGVIVAADASQGISMQIINKPSAWDVELGYEGGFGIRDYKDGQDGAVGAYKGNSAGDPVTGIVSGIVTDLPVLDGRWDSAIIPVKKGVFQLKVELAFHNGLRGFYFDNAFLLGNPIIQRVDHVVNFTWGLGRISQYGTDYVSVRWLGKLLSPLDGQYTFLINADDNVRLWVNEELLVDKWWSFAGQTYGNITLTAGWFNDIRIEYRDQSGPALCSLWWVTPAGGAATVVPANVLYFTNDLPGSPFLFNVSAGYAVAAQVGVGFASSATPSSSPSVGASHTASVSASATVSPSPSVNSALALPPLTYTPQGSIAFGQGLVSGYAGETLSFTIVSRDKFGNDRGDLGVSDGFNVLAVLRNTSVLTYNGTSGGIGVREVAGSVNFNPDTYYHDVTWIPTVAGVYDVYVQLWADWRLYDDIYGSPFLAVIAPARTSPRESDVWGPGIIAGVAGTPFLFNILSRDNLGNIRGLEGDNWQVLANLQGTGIGLQGSCVDPGRNGTFQCQYVPTLSGTYRLGITLSGLNARNSPYTVNVTFAALNSARCNASGPGLSSAIVDTPVSFLLYNRDSFGNARPVNDIANTSITVSTTTSSVANVSVAYNGSNTYLVTYTASSAGAQNLYVRVNGLDISGSPFHPIFFWPYVTVANRSTAAGSGITTGYTDRPVVFYITARDNGGHLRNVTGDNWTVYAIHSLQPQHFYYGACVDVSLNGTYTCTWNPRVVGIYNMTVTLNGPGNVTVPTANIIGSPFHPNITFGALNPSQCLAVGAGVANALLNFPVTFYILNRDTYGNSRPVNDFTGVTLSTDAMSDITNISWAYVANDTFSVKYTPLSTGTKTLVVKVNGVEIHGSPFHPVVFEQ